MRLLVVAEPESGPIAERFSARERRIGAAASSTATGAHLVDRDV
jgi:hypothetical protein